MRRLLLATAAFGLLASPAMAAVIVTVDNYATAQGPVEDLVLGGGGVSSGTTSYTLGAHTYDREFSVELLAFLAPVQAQAEVVSGVFDILNGTGERSEVILTYTIPASLEAFKNSITNVTGLAFFFDLVARDLNPITISATLNGNSLDPVIPPLAGPGIYRFDVPIGAIDGTLEFTFNGDPGYDITIDNLRLWIGRNNEPFDPTPAPAALGLFGLGLAGLAMARRRRSA
ncbi:MAG: PEP-CTERM sorting domain-containing protein [Thermaurantiacus sp.]